MLGLGFSVDIDVKKLKMPIHFERKNECVHCGYKGSLMFIDKFGRPAKKDINPFDHIKCSNCGRIYSILWETDDDNGKMYPSPVDPSIGRIFNNFVHKSNIRENGVKEFD